MSIAKRDRYIVLRVGLFAADEIELDLSQGELIAHGHNGGHVSENSRGGGGGGPGTVGCEEISGWQVTDESFQSQEGLGPFQMILHVAVAGLNSRVNLPGLIPEAWIECKQKVEKDFILVLESRMRWAKSARRLEAGC